MRRFSVVLALLAAVSLPRVSLAGVIESYAFDSVTSALEVTRPISVSPPPQGTFTGALEIAFTSDVSGAIVGGPATADLEDPGAGNLVGDTLSFGGALGSFHAFGSFTRTLAGLTFDVAGLSVVASLTFNGEETGRVIVPEPGTVLLLALALGALLVARRR
jgi:hypothetical protein